MGKKYTHLSSEERKLLFRWHHYEKRGVREIGRLLKRSHTTISREIKRHTTTHYLPTYYPNPAELSYRLTVRRRGQRQRLKCGATRDYVTEKLQIGWSPEIIAGRLRRQESVPYINHESIYQFVYLERRDLIVNLPRKHRKRRIKFPTRSTAQKVRNKTPIDQRPAVINERCSFGHWESDSIVPNVHKPGCNVLVERKTRLVHITKLSAKTAQSTHLAIVGRLGQYKKEFTQSITYDNGSENGLHLKTNAALSCASFFCAPYHSWEKGSVEQCNGLIRRYIPKGMDFELVSDKQISEIEQLLNERPRKCLDFKTPNEAYQDYLSAKLSSA
jgi:transposase, IS30 family